MLSLTGLVVGLSSKLGKEKLADGQTHKPKERKIKVHCQLGTHYVLHNAFPSEKHFTALFPPSFETCQVYLLYNLLNEMTNIKRPAYSTIKVHRRNVRDQRINNCTQYGINEAAVSFITVYTPVSQKTPPTFLAVT